MRVVCAVRYTLVDAAKNHDKDAVRSLLKAHADVNAPEADGTTALHWAAHANDLETVQLLLRAGANAKAANRYGVTPLSEAATYRQRRAGRSACSKPARMRTR